MSFKAGQVGNTLDRQPRVTTGGKSGGLVVSYKDAGVDIDLGNALVERIKPACKVSKHRLRFFIHTASTNHFPLLSLLLYSQW